VPEVITANTVINPVIVKMEAPVTLRPANAFVRRVGMVQTATHLVEEKNTVSTVIRNVRRVYTVTAPVYTPPDLVCVPVVGEDLAVIERAHPDTGASDVSTRVIVNMAVNVDLKQGLAFAYLAGGEKIARNPVNMEHLVIIVYSNAIV